MRAAVVLVPAMMLAIAAPAAAQQRKKTPKPPTAVTVSNARTSTLTDFTLSTDAGQPVAGLRAPLAPGKKITLKLAKGATCMLVVSAVYDDGSENAGGQVDVCKDKAIRFTD